MAAGGSGCTSKDNHRKRKKKKARHNRKMRRFRKVKETKDKLESGVGEQQREREAVSGACVLGNVIGRRGSQEE